MYPFYLIIVYVFVYFTNTRLLLAKIEKIYINVVVYIENNTWVRGNTIFISSVEHDISRVSAANE